MERLLAQLTDRLTKAYGDRLVSVILYGSAADGNHHSRYSDLNVFCVLTEITQKELVESEPIFRWWREQGNPAPLLMTEDETRTSTDSFPIEFHDMQERRKVIFGRDVISSLVVDRRYYRAHLEHDLRSKLLRLRQQAAAVLSDRDALLKLCIDSVSTFCVLGRHALLISGRSCSWKKREVAEALGPAMGSDMSPFLTLLDVREGKTAPQEVDPANLFGKYLSRIQELISFVDRLEE
jgi:predicted nucleotidyltransferase